MKGLALLLLMLPLIALSQDQMLPEKDGKVIYEEVDSIPGVIKDELYNRSKIWVVRTFKSANAVLQLEDKDNGQLIGKGNFQYENSVFTASATWTCDFTIQIDCRENKVRIKCYDISAHSKGDATAEHFNKYKNHSQHHIKAINQNIIALMADYKTALTKPASDNF